MRRAWDIAGKELLQTRRDRTAALFMFILPLAFTAFFGLLFQSYSDNRLPVGVVDQDGLEGAAALRTSLLTSDALALKTVKAADADRLVREQDLAAVVVIPQGFSQALDRGERPKLEIVRLQASSGARSAEVEVRSAAERLATEHIAARVAADVTGAPANVTLDQTRRLIANPAVAVKVEAAGTREGAVPSGFDQSSPGMLINWILFGTLSVAVVIVVERRSGTLRRLLTTRASKAQVIFGKGMAMMALSLIQQTVLIAVGQFAFGVDYLRDPAALIPVMIALSLFATSVGLLVGSLVKSEAAVVATTIIVNMVLAALSGAWFPLSIAGPTFATMGHLLPTSWLLDAFQGIVLKGWGITDVLPAVGITLAFCAAMLTIAVWRFRFE